MSNNKKAPAIRFKGFNDDWEERKLGEVGTDIIAGGDIEKNKIKDSGKYPVIANALTNDGIVGYYEEEFRIKAPAVTVTGRGDVGHAKARNINFTPVVRLLSITSNHDVNFLENAINNISVMVESTGVPQLTVPQLEKYKISIPNNPGEEEAIGILFIKFDNLITLQKRRCDKLILLKKAMLEQMFPKGKKSIPEIRFKDFNDDWEERKLGEVAERFDNLRIPVTESNRVKGVTPYYGANGILDYVDGFTHDGEFILIAEDGANDLNNYPVHYVSGKVWVNNHAHVIQAKEGIADNKFLRYSFKTFNIEPYLVGGSRAKLNANIMMDLDINTPPLGEQFKIGEFFRTLDHLITLQKRKLEKLKVVKKSMLDKMFI